MLPDGRHADLAGGWMDAGDTLKFTGTNAYCVVALLLAARLDPADAPALTDAAGVGVRWLRKAHPAAGVFVSQVGDIRVDHRRDPARGFDPAADDRSPVGGLARRRALTGIGTDAGGRVAAALALAAQAEADPTRRAGLVEEARAWYQAGKAAGRLAPRLPEDPYPSASGSDDMALGATELHRATGDPALLAEATAWLGRAEPAESATWDAVGPLAAAELCGIGSQAGCSFLRDAAGHAARRARKHVLATAGVLAWGTTTMQGGAGATLAMAGSAVLAADARDWMLGRNPWGASFVAGLGPDAPVHMHHWAGRSPSRLRGAVVGGPTTRAVLRDEHIRYRANRFDGPAGVYEDRAADYVTSEPAVVYAASAVLLFAAMAG
jgi:endoglucanase